MPVGITGDLIADRYRMRKRLGSGGMATVFLAQDERLEREVAIKRLHADSPEDVGRRFAREAKVGASLNHPSIVAVYDTVTDDEGVLIVMEYVAGHTLRDEIARGPIDPSRAIEILCAVAAALDHAHEHGVVHRDVKPANVLVDEARDVVKLADLGIAAAAEQTRITHSGTVLGTASYMAPERLDGGAGGPAVDVYALAAVAFEMLSGRKAVEGTSPLEIARRVATQEPADLREAVPGAPADAAEALKRGLAKDPAERQRSAGALVRELSGAYAAQAESERSQRRTAVVADAPRAAAAPAPAPARAGREPTTAPRTQHRGGLPRWLAPAALAAVALIAVLAVALSAGGGDEQGGEPRTADETQQSEGSGSGGSASEQGEQPQDAAPAAPEAEAPPAGSTGEGPGTPGGAVSSFYGAAAADDYDTAWSLLTPNAQGTLGGRSAFEQQQSTLESIEFPSLEATEESGDSATVSFRSVATHTDQTDRCTGSLGLVRQGDTWLIDDFQSITCDTTPR
jgi:serine/threonine-protein kinase